MKEQKPKGLLSYLHGLFSKQEPAVAPPSGPAMYCGKITLDVNQPTLEAMSVAIQTAIRAKVLDGIEERRLALVFEQLSQQLPRETIELMSAATRYACKQYKDRQLESLFIAAKNAPSQN